MLAQPGGEIEMTRRRIRALARAYDRVYGTSPWARAERAIKTRLRRRRLVGALYLTRVDLVWIAEWKTARIRARIARNTPAGVRGLTRAAFLTRDDARRLRVLLGLSGVGLAVASVVLHFAEPARYPIYDVRVRTALRGLGIRERFPPTPGGWTAYVGCLRTLARRWRVSLRTLDKALWLRGGA